MHIENNILEISKALFQNKDNWKYVKDEQKESFFFIFNRYFAKKYPHLSQLLNDKTINKPLALDLWFIYMKDKPYPNWFWGKTKSAPKSKEEELKQEFKEFCHYKDEEFEFLERNYKEQLEEEINYFIQEKYGDSRKKLVHSKGTK